MSSKRKRRPAAVHISRQHPTASDNPLPTAPAERSKTIYRVNGRIGQRSTATQNISEPGLCTTSARSLQAGPHLALESDSEEIEDVGSTGNSAEGPWFSSFFTETSLEPEGKADPDELQVYFDDITIHDITTSEVSPRICTGLGQR